MIIRFVLFAGVLIAFYCALVSAQQNSPVISAKTTVSLGNKSVDGVGWNGELLVKGKSLVKMGVNAGNTFVEGSGSVSAAGNVGSWSTPVNASSGVLFRGMVINADTVKSYCPAFTGRFLSTPGGSEPVDLTWKVLTNAMNISKEHKFFDWEWQKYPNVKIVFAYTSDGIVEKSFDCPVGTVAQGKRMNSVAEAIRNTIRDSGGHLGQFVYDIVMNSPVENQSFSNTICHIDNNCNFAQKYELVYRITIKASGKMFIPKWNLSMEDEKLLNPDVRNEWNRFLENIKKHEEGHEKIVTDYVAEQNKSNSIENKLVVWACTGKSISDSKNSISEFIKDKSNVLNLHFDELKNNVLNNIKQRQDDYDTKTNHGATQGATFDPNIPLHRNF